jgi:hypothetical protein
VAILLLLLLLLRLYWGMVWEVVLKDGCPLQHPPRAVVQPGHQGRQV